MTRRSANPTTAFAVLAALGTGLRLALVLGGWTDKSLLPDDAFYYFTIARNVVQGHGASFDGVAPTNGFHPLWLVVILPIFALAGAAGSGLWAPVRAALALTALLDLATGWMLFRMLRRLGHERGAIWACALWFLFPTQVFMGLQGLECSLSLCVFALLLTVMLRVYEERNLTPRGGALIGFIVGLAFLARTDNGVLAPLTVGVAAFAFAVRDGQSWKRLPVFLAAAAGTAALMTLPWFGWNLATFGTPWQVSGQAKLSNPLLGGHLDAAAATYHIPHWAARFSLLVGFLWRPIQFAIGTLVRWPLFIGLSALAAATLALLCVPLARRLRTTRSNAEVALIAGAAAYLLGHGAVYAFVMGFYVEWYAAVPGLVVLFLFVGIGADAVLEAASPRRRAACAALLVALGVLLYAWHFAGDGRDAPRFAERGALGVLRHIEEHAPGARRIGIFGFGAVGYFTPEVGAYRIVGLDGMVNNQGVVAWHQGRFLEYLESTVDVVFSIGGTRDLDYMLGQERVPEFLARYPQWFPGAAGYGRPALGGTR